jgi:hypothetical protein
MQVSAAAAFLRKVKEAVAERSEHVVAFQEFNASLPAESTVEWTQMVKEWEHDQTKPNPFESKQRRKSNLTWLTLSKYLQILLGITEHQVCLELAQDDASSLGDSSQVIHEHLPASMLISQGLELEEQQ